MRPMIRMIVCLHRASSFILQLNLEVCHSRSPNFRWKHHFLLSWNPPIARAVVSSADRKWSFNNMRDILRLWNQRCRVLPPWGVLVAK